MQRVACLCINLRSVFLSFLRYHLAVKIDLFEVYFRQVFHLLYDKGVTIAEALLYYSIILWVVV